MDTSSARARLAKTLFGGLAFEHLDRLAEIVTPRDWVPGTAVFREGQTDEYLYLVEEGLVAIDLMVPGKGRTCILTVGPGELFGWSTLFEPRSKRHGARVTQPTRALALEAGLLRSLCDAEPRLGYDVTRCLLRAVAERLDSARMQLQDFLSPPSHQERNTGVAAPSIES